MTLTDEQREAINKGQAISVMVEGTRCVLVREDFFTDGVRIEPNPRAMYNEVVKVLDQMDENADQYLEYLDEAR